MFEEICLKFSDCIIAASEGMLNEIPKKYQNKAIILLNGVNIKLFKNKISKEEVKNLRKKYKIPKNKKIITFIGNWEKWVNVKILIESKKYLPEDYAVLVVGRGHQFEEIKNSVSNDPNIIMTGRIRNADAIKLLQISDVCVTPYSKTTPCSVKGFYPSRKNFEYLAAGKPIVMSNIVSRESFLKENENVLLYRPDEPNDLAKKIIFIVNNKNLYKKISKNNLKLAENFSWEKVVKNSGLVKIIKERLS
jgi:glycosyltransferase involved in cell wall biosynthesis